MLMVFFYIFFFIIGGVVVWIKCRLRRNWLFLMKVVYFKKLRLKFLFDYLVCEYNYFLMEWLY